MTKPKFLTGPEIALNKRVIGIYLYSKIALHRLPTYTIHGLTMGDQ